MGGRVRWWACCCTALSGRAGSGLTWTTRCSASSPRSPATPRMHTVPAGRQRWQCQQPSSPTAGSSSLSGSTSASQMATSSLHGCTSAGPLATSSLHSHRNSTQLRAEGQLYAPPLPPPVILAPNRAGGFPLATAASSSSCTRSTSRSVPPAPNVSGARHTACCQRELGRVVGRRGHQGKPTGPQMPGYCCPPTPPHPHTHPPPPHSPPDPSPQRL